MNRIVLASQNSGKIKEIKSILSKTELDIHLQSDFGVAEIEETGLTFIENALLKARHACLATNLPSIADDTGLVVPYLDGKPGLYSARYAGTPKNDKANYEKLLSELIDVPIENRDAYFYCVIVFMQHANDPAPLICEGRWNGSILFSPQGKHGFGYDPIFYVPSHHCSAAELSLEIKNQISHRGQALNQLVQSF
ncbi:MAG: RdgB/HAM1 family non-canonical purine NTP pyrophosphatase [Gammaproteobacteria bacterium]